MTKRTLLIIVGVLVLGVVALTAVALVLEKNPPVVKEPTWDSPQTRALAARACFDCHSNQTQYPWYDKMPVGSWIAVFDTLRGRNRLNFSEWGVARPALFSEGGGEGGGRGGEGGGGDFARVIQDGSMPPAAYTFMHPNAVLSDTEKQQLIDGLQKTFQSSQTNP